MLKFSSHTLVQLNEEKVVNKHLDHLEDLMLIQGKEGLFLSLDFLRDTIETLETGKTDMGMSTKWDGKPAVVCGINPENKRFFVATKGAFNKEVKAYHTEEEVRKDVKIPELADKLVDCLRYLPSLGIKGVLQGDLMFTTESKKPVTVDGVKCIGFQPNTILYTVEENSPIGRHIASAKVGIVFHTEYKGPTMMGLSAVSYNFSTKRLKKTPDVWFTDPNVVDVTGALFTPQEASHARSMLALCQKDAAPVQSFLGVLLKQEEIMAYLMPYINGTINGGLSTFTTSGFLLYVKSRFEKELNKLKTEKGKAAKRVVMEKAINFITAYEKPLSQTFDLHNRIATVKEIILSKFYGLSRFGHFFVDDTGLVPTDPEGFVLARKGRVVKLVNRLRFSRQNRKVNS